VQGAALVSQIACQQKIEKNQWPPRVVLEISTASSGLPPGSMWDGRSLAATSRVGAVSADDRAGAVATVGVLLSGDKVVMRASDDRTRSGGLAVGGLIALVRLARARLRFVCGELRAGRG